MQPVKKEVLCSYNSFTEEAKKKTFPTSEPNIASIILLTM